MNKRAAVLTLTLCCIPMLGSSVRAQESVPSACEDAELVEGASGDGNTRLSYLTGARILHRQVLDTWEATGENCLTLESFSTTMESLITRFSVVQAPSAASACRFSGAYDGIASALDILAERCKQSCSDDKDRSGAARAGAFAARAYCELSFALGGVSEHVAFFSTRGKICGSEYEDSCESSFDQELRRYRGYDGTSCERFIRGSYARSRSRSRSSQCSFYKSLEWAWSDGRF